MSDESIQWNKPTETQRSLLRLLASKWAERPDAWVDSVLVSPMDDGGMGSLKLTIPEVTRPSRQFGRKVAEHEYTDADGVVVLASLYLDQEDLPFELDVWKTDFSPVTGGPA